MLSDTSPTRFVALDRIYLLECMRHRSGWSVQLMFLGQHSYRGLPWSDFHHHPQWLARPSWSRWRSRWPGYWLSVFQQIIMCKLSHKRRTGAADDSVPARLGKGQGAKEIGHNLARERPKFGHNLVRKRHKIGHSLESDRWKHGHKSASTSIFTSAVWKHNSNYIL